MSDYALFFLETPTHRHSLGVGWVKPPCATQHPRVVPTKLWGVPGVVGSRKSLTQPTSSLSRTDGVKPHQRFCVVGSSPTSPVSSSRPAPRSSYRDMRVGQDGILGRAVARSRIPRLRPGREGGHPRQASTLWSCREKPNLVQSLGRRLHWVRCPLSWMAAGMTGGECVPNDHQINPIRINHARTYPRPLRP
jgi:hypothetical protein